MLPCFLLFIFHDQYIKYTCLHYMLFFIASSHLISEKLKIKKSSIAPKPFMSLDLKVTRVTLIFKCLS
jgi:hypothetical protein